MWFCLKEKGMPSHTYTCYSIPCSFEMKHKHIFWVPTHFSYFLLYSTQDCFWNTSRMEYRTDCFCAPFLSMVLFCAYICSSTLQSICFSADFSFHSRFNAIVDDMLVLLRLLGIPAWNTGRPFLRSVPITISILRKYLLFKFTILRFGANVGFCSLSCANTALMV